MQEHFLGKIAVKAILVKDGKVLITRDSRDADLWEIPGGRLDSGSESAEACLKREVAEELGVDAVIGRLVHTQQFKHLKDGTPHFHLVYEVSLADPDCEFSPDPVEISEMRWISKDELSSYKLFQNCQDALKAYWRL